MIRSVFTVTSGILLVLIRRTMRRRITKKADDVAVETKE